MDKPTLKIYCDADGIRVSDDDGEIFACGWRRTGAVDALLEKLSDRGYIELIDESPEEDERQEA